MKKEVLRMSHICFNDGIIEIVRDGSLHLFESEVVGLIGNNHAGKSQLMGAVSGEFPCDSGDIWIAERRKKIGSIKQGRKAGIFLIKEKSSLINEFTIRDTLKLNFAFVEKKIKFSEYFKSCQAALDFLGIKEEYDTRIQSLNFHKRVLIEIALALICHGKILVLDRVMSMLSSQAREHMKHVFRILQMKGLSILLIENQVDVIRGHISRLYVMRRGGVVAELGAEEVGESLVLSLSEGEVFEAKQGQFHKMNEMNGTEKSLEFKNVYTDDNVLRGLNFSLYGNECLGLWNRNRHSGKSLLDVLGGNICFPAGEIWIGSKCFTGRMPVKVKRYGLMTLPETDQLFTNMSVEENIRFAALQENAYWKTVLKTGELRYLVGSLCSEYLADDGYRRFANQQIPDSALIQKKVSLCRAIAGGARLIAYDNPGLKLDVREKEIFWQDILRTQRRGIGQIVVSAQIEDLYPIANRILQIEEGRIS